MTVPGNLKDNHRYQKGFESGQHDVNANIDSDMEWYKHTKFDLEDSEYVSGYKDGYKIGPRKFKDKKKKK